MVLVTNKAQMAPYQKRSLAKSKTQYSMLKDLELSKNSHIELIEKCNDKK